MPYTVIMGQPRIDPNRGHATGTPSGAPVPCPIPQSKRCCRLSDGTDAVLRPLEIRDHQACCEFFAACSPKSLYNRFERRRTEPPKALASELCDADRSCELVMVAEIDVAERRRIIGVAQLLSDPVHDVAEYAVLVADPWQGMGLGSHFTDFLLDIARRWAVRRVIGEFSPGNVRIIRIFESREFELSRNGMGQVVSGVKRLLSG